MSNKSKMGVNVNAQAFRGRVYPTSSGVKVGGIFTLEGWSPVKASLSWAAKLECLGFAHAANFIRKLGVMPASTYFKLHQEIQELFEAPQLMFSHSAHNRVVTAGLTDIVDKYFKGSAYTAAHYVGLTDGTPTIAAGDIMSSHVGWTEITNYTEANRQTFTPGTVSAGAVDNSGSKATFTADTGGFTTGGAFLTDNSTRGGTTGTLVCAVAFTGGDEVLSAAETVTVQYDFSAADDGV